MSTYQIELHISPDQMLGYYRGSVHHVVARSSTGQIIQFPVASLQRFVTHDGVQGLFLLTCGPDHKLASIERISPPT